MKFNPKPALEELPFRLARRFFVLVAFGVTAACTSAPLGQPMLLPQPQQQKVLMVTSGDPPLARDIARALNNDSQRSDGLPPTVVDVLEVDSVQGLTSSVRELLPRIHQYQAIFVDSITYARAVQILVSDVPIVFEGVDDPVERCLANSVVRPGRNATGYMHQLAATEKKMLQVLKDAFPGTKVVTVLVAGDNFAAPSCSPNEPYWVSSSPPPCQAGAHPLNTYIEDRFDAQGLQRQALSLGLRLRFQVVCQASDLAALRSAEPIAGNAWFVPWHGLFDDNQKALVEALNGSGRPAIYPSVRYVREGGLMALAAPADLGPDRASILSLVQVVRGHSPATLPIQAPRGLRLYINETTAETTGNRPTLFSLRVADELIR